MGMRNQLDPLGGQTGLVDAFIGNAYKTVEAVALHLREIKYLAHNMASVLEAARIKAALFPERVMLVTGLSGSIGVPVEISLPDGVTASMIRSSSVCIVSPLGDVAMPESGMFNANIRSGSLFVALLPTAPLSLVRSEIRWRIAYEG